MLGQTQHYRSSSISRHSDEIPKDSESSLINVENAPKILSHVIYFLTNILLSTFLTFVTNKMLLQRQEHF